MRGSAEPCSVTSSNVTLGQWSAMPRVCNPRRSGSRGSHPSKFPRASVLAPDMHTTSRERHASAALCESGSLLRTDRIAGRGRVLLTTSDCRAGDVLLVEQPMAFVQLPECEEVARLCAGCSCQLGSPADGLRRLGVLQRMPTSARRTAVAALPCEHCNRLFYCSARCRAAHRRRAHAATCSADAAHRAAFDSFRSFALASCHTQLLAAELVAATLMLAPHTAAHGSGNGGGGGGGGGSGSGGRGGGGGGGGSGGGGGGRTRRRQREEEDATAAAWLWLNEWVSEPWPDIVALPECSTAEEARVRAQCRADCREGRRLLLLALERGGCTAGWLDETTWERLVGLVAQNATAILPNAPTSVRAYLERLVHEAVAAGVSGQPARLAAMAGVAALAPEVEASPNPDPSPSPNASPNPSSSPNPNPNLGGGGGGAGVAAALPRRGGG